jgi:hypothetical protein
MAPPPCRWGVGGHWPDQHTSFRLPVLCAAACGCSVDQQGKGGAGVMAQLIPSPVAKAEPVLVGGSGSTSTGAQHIV